jgi:hypothetical protein
LQIAAVEERFDPLNAAFDAASAQLEELIPRVDALEEKSLLPKERHVLPVRLRAAATSAGMLRN